MLTFYKPKITRCSSCGKETDAKNKINVCSDCYKTAFSIEDVVAKKKVDWSKMKGR